MIPPPPHVLFGAKGPRREGKKRKNGVSPTTH